MTPLTSILEPLFVSITPYPSFPCRVKIDAGNVGENINAARVVSEAKKARKILRADVWSGAPKSRGNRNPRRGTGGLGDDPDARAGFSV
jgi:hypothetical protein